MSRRIAVRDRNVAPDQRRADDVAVCGTQRARGVGHALGERRERRAGRNAEHRLDDDLVAEPAPALAMAAVQRLEDLAQRGRPDRAVLVLLPGALDGLKVVHRFAAVDAAEAVGARRIAALLRVVVTVAARVPVAEAIGVAPRGDRLRVILRESPVIGDPLGQRARLAGRRPEENARRDPVLNGVRVFVQHDVRVLRIVRPAVAEQEHALPDHDAAFVDGVVRTAQPVRIDVDRIRHQLPRSGVTERLQIALRAIDGVVDVHFFELRLAAIE